MKLAALEKVKESQTADFRKDRKAAVETPDVDDGPDWRPEQME